MSSFLCHVVRTLQVEFEKVARNILVSNGMNFQRLEIHKFCQKNHDPVVVRLEMSLIKDFHSKNPDLAANLIYVLI